MDRRTRDTMAGHPSSGQEASCMTADRSTRSTTRKQPARARTAKKGTPARAGATALATLAIDVGGTGLKASVLDPAGAMEVDRVRVATSYPCPPTELVETLRQLV